MVKHQNGNFWLPASFAPFLPWLLQRSQRWKGSHLTFDLLDCETRSQLVAGAGPLSAEMLPVLGSAWGIAASRRCAKCDPSNVSVSLWIFFTSKKNGSSATTAFSLCTFQTTVADTWSQPRSFTPADQMANPLTKALNNPKSTHFPYTFL